MHLRPIRSTPVLMLTALLAACAGDGKESDTGVTDTGETDTDTDSDADTDSDTDADTDSDTDTDTDTDTDSDTDTDTDTGTVPLTDITVLLAPIPAETAWEDLDPALQQALEDHAEVIFAEYRAEWSTAGLLAKEAVVLPDTGAIRANVDTYLTNQFSTVIDPVNFSVDGLSNADLSDALKKLYLVHIGTSRNTLVYTGVLSTDWDATGSLLDPSIPDPQTLLDLQAYADGVAGELESLGNGLGEEERALADAALFIARSLRTGSLGFYAYGGDDLQTPWGLEVWGPEPTFDDADLGTFSSVEEFLRYQNAMWMGEVEYVSENNLDAADFVRQIMGGDALYESLLPDPDAAKNAILLAHWHTERMYTLPGATDVCYPYSAAEQSRIVDSFTADLKVEIDAPSLTPWLSEFQTSLDVEGAALTAGYQDAALEGIEVLFDSTELDQAQREAVETAILNETRFGVLSETVAAVLTAETGSADAADAWLAELAAIPVAGGDPAVLDPVDEALVHDLWAEVRGALVARYSGPTRVHDIDAVLPEDVVVDLSYGIRTTSDGVITVGLGLPQTEAVLYVALTHEALHAVGFLADLHASGAAFEGAASLTEQLVGRDILREFVPDDDEPFYLLNTAGADARRYGISDANAAVLTTDCAGGIDSADLAVEVAASWGLAGAALDEVPIRSHWGTQFISYLTGHFVYRDIVDYFDAQIEPGVDNGIDPFDMYTCGLTVPALTPEVAADLQACLGL